MNNYRTSKIKAPYGWEIVVRRTSNPSMHWLGAATQQSDRGLWVAFFNVTGLTDTGGVVGTRIGTYRTLAEAMQAVEDQADADFQRKVEGGVEIFRNTLRNLGW